MLDGLSGSGAVPRRKCQHLTHIRMDKRASSRVVQPTRLLTFNEQHGASGAGERRNL
jgi:hypothetical protein